MVVEWCFTHGMGVVVRCAGVEEWWVGGLCGFHWEDGLGGACLIIFIV